MKSSPKSFNQGFTLIEVLVVLGIFILLASLGLFMSFDVYRATFSRSERDMVVVLLEKARSQSLNNVNQTTHGFCFLTSGAVVTSYEVFEGSDCTAAVKELIPAGSDISLSPSPALPATGIIFSQLSGDSNYTGTITLTQNTQSKTVSINSEGMIDW